MGISSGHIKHSLLKYWRFKRGCVVGTEVSIARGIADIVAVSDDLKKSYEVEVKISISDLKSEFKNKGYKHKSSYTTNYFYFCFPESLLEKALPIIEDQNDKFGIIIYSEKRHNRQSPEEDRLSVYKRAKKLNNNSNDKTYRLIVKRVVSELISMYDHRFKEAI